MFLRVFCLSAFLLFSSLFSANLSKDKKVGVAVNPFYLFVISPSSSGEKLISGTISYFDHVNYVEIAVPLHYMKINDSDYRQQTIDIHYRKYANDYIGGFYLSGFARLARLEGRSSSNLDGYNYAKQVKFGLGVGLGAKVFLKNGIYWGAGLSIGRYITGDNEIFDQDSFLMTDDLPFILDVELFKFGYAF